MANGGQITSVLVNFDALAYDDGIRMERSNRKPPNDSVVFFRVHGGDGYALVGTSGSISREINNLRRYTEELIYVQNNGIAKLTYPAVTSVKDIDKIGNFIYSDGTTVPKVTLTYDPAVNGVVIDPPDAFGVMKVIYYAPYDLWRATFSGSCPEVRPYNPPQDGNNGSADDDEVSPEGRKPMMVYAIKDAEIKATLFLEPPPCVYPGRNINGLHRTKGKLPKLVAEIDDAYPIARLSTFHQPQLAAGCRIRLYPALSSPVHEATSGTLTHRHTVINRYYSETVTFNGDPSAQLSYQPKAGTSISIHPTTTNFVDIWGMSFDASTSVRGPGETINAVNWITEKTYSESVSREVLVDELVVTDMFGNSRPVYGSVIVSYVTSYTEFDFLFHYNFDLGWFEEASVVFSEGDQVADITLPPPPIRGV